MVDPQRLAARRLGGLVRLAPELVEGKTPSPSEMAFPRRVDGTKLHNLEMMVGLTLSGMTRAHPCKGARSVSTNGNLYFAVYSDMRSVDIALRALEDFEQYCAITDPGDSVVKSLVLVFTEPVESEEDFARKYWAFAQIIHDIDCQRDDYPAGISSNPLEDTFELCVNGRAVFSTTLHSAQSRPARKFTYPAWVMNQTSQFDALREQGQFTEWQRLIRNLDSKLDPTGQPNPILVDHGAGSAAGQLPGYAIEPCPFIPRVAREDREAALEALIERAGAEFADEQIIERIKARAEAGRMRRGEPERRQA